MRARVRGLRVDGAGGQPILAGVDFDVPAGTVTALVGASGGGKSSALLALLGLLEPPRRRTGGHFELDGVDFWALDGARRRALLGDRLTWIPQETASALSPSMRVLDQVAEVVRTHTDAGRSGAQARAADALRGAGLDPDRLRAYPHELSGGQRQRVLIAMATVLGPALLLADEPTTALDGPATEAVLGRLRAAAAKGAAVLWVSHELAWVEAFADRALLLVDGRVVVEAETAQLSRHEAWRRFAAGEAVRTGS